MANTSVPQPFSNDWLSTLRERFLEIARRRVPESVAEDLVQDALGIVLAKGPDKAAECGEQVPPLRWSFLVLRNVIGNHYQKRRSHQTLEGIDQADGRPDALSALASREKIRTIQEAMQTLEGRSPDCARWLWAVARGRKSGSVARQEGIDEKLFYRRLYRCRQTLAGILKTKGVNG